MRGVVRKPGKLGFTLIELLVVVAIIAVLSSLLLATLASAKAQADSAVCKSNLRQIAFALNLYTADFESYPAPFQVAGGDPSQGAAAGWAWELQPYTSAIWPRDADTTNQYGPYLPGSHVKNIYDCPGYDRLPGCYTWPQFGAYGFNFEGVGMSVYPQSPLGLAGVSQNGSDLAVQAVKANEIVAPSRTLAVADSYIDPVVALPVGSETSSPMYLGNYWLEAEVTSDFDSQFRPMLTVIKRRHSSIWNTGFCDAHVEALHTLNLLYLPWQEPRGPMDAVSRRWNIDNQPHSDRLH